MCVHARVTAKIAACFLFHKYRSNSHIERAAVNLAVPRDVCTYPSASKFIDRGKRDFERRRMMEIKVRARQGTTN